ncbi:hypothetical protein ACT7DA_11965 [Bacillus pacificus]
MKETNSRRKGGLFFYYEVNKEGIDLKDKKMFEELFCIFSKNKKIIIVSKQEYRERATALTQLHNIHIL